MQHLTRKQFLDLDWGAAELDAAAEFWLRLYEAAAPKHNLSTPPSYTVEVRLRGFPRPQAGGLRDELKRRLAAGHDDSTGSAPATIDRPDPDTLTITFGPDPGDRAPPAGLGLPLLAGPPFDGLLAEVRLSAEGSERGVFRRPRVHVTLVLVGELREGRLLLKGVWRSGSSGWEDELCWSAPWTDQDQWLTALERFREAGEVPAKLGKQLFPPRGADRGAGLAVRLIHVPLDRPRLAGLAARVLIFLALFAAIGFGANHLLRAEDWLWKWIWFVPLAVLGWIVLWLAWTFARNEARLWFQGYREFRAAYTRLYEGSVKIVPMTWEEAEARLDNPWVRKYTAELVAAGFAHAGDLRAEPGVGGDSIVRVFYAPDGVTYLNLFFQLSTHEDPGAAFRNWPACVTFLALTFFADGGWASSVNGRALGYRRKRTGPEHLARVFPDADEPAGFARQHAAAAEAFAAETGRSPLRHERFDLYVRRQDALQDEERRLFAEEPYTRGDHLRWFLQSPRREYRG